MMKLTAIGTSGSYPGPHAAASCYLLQIEAERTWNIVLDLGSGALGPLQRWMCSDLRPCPTRRWE